MIPLLKQWRDEESTMPMLRYVDFDKLSGAPEYQCVVKTPTIAASRFLCKVSLKGYNEPDVAAWCDTSTGTLYWLDGRCMSGPLELHGKPVLTGRTVPSRSARNREGESRAAIW